MDTLAKIRDCRTDIAARAGAGAGKTTALVEKYMAELMTPTKEGYMGVDRIAAITFTEKAAEEMSQRVRIRLTEKIDELRERLRATGSTAGLLDEPGAPEDRKLLNHLIRQRQGIKSAYISTIHAFCARLLWENPLEAGVDPGFAVMDETSAARLLEAATLEAVLNKLRQGHPGVRRLVRDHGFTSRGRGEGIKERIIWILPLLKAANMAPADLLALRGKVAGAPPSQPPGAVAAELKILVSRLLSFRQSSREYKFAGAVSEMLDDLAAPGGPPLSTAGEAMELAEELEKGVKSRKGYIEGKDGFEESLRAAWLVEMIAGPVIENAALEDLKAFVELASGALAAYRAAKEEKSALDYDDLQEKAQSLLARPNGVLDGYKKMLRRILIDEFQDTDKLQAEILNLLAPPGEGRLFIVGDVKQSIYGFRGADPGIFIGQAERILKSGGEEFPLVESRRATPALTAYFNRYLAAVMAEAGSESGGWFDPAKDALEAVRSGKGVDTAVCRIIADAENIAQSRLVEAEAIAAEMRRLALAGIKVEGEDGALRPVRYGDMALLLRSLNNHEKYEGAMRRWGIPFQVIKGRGFYDCQEIKDLANLLSLLFNPGDGVALASVLRSPLVGVTDQTVLKLFVGEDGKKRPGPFPPGGKIPASITGADRERLEEFDRLRTGWMNILGRVEASEMLETVLAQTGYGAVMMSRDNGERIVANIFKLIERARTFEADWTAGHLNFIAGLNAMITSQAQEAKAEPAAGEEDVARIMTVHQSKGLEFAVVFVGDIGFTPKHTGGAMIFSPQAGLGLKAFDISTGKWRSGPSHKSVKASVDAARREELKRLLYVAMTRARDRLILSGPAEKGGDWVKWINALAGDDVQTILPGGSAKGSPAPEKGEDSPLVRSILAGERPPARQRIQPPQPRQDPVQARLTITALADFALCPRIFHYQSVGEARDPSAGTTFGLAGEVADPMQMGTLVHRALESAPLGKGSPPDGIRKAVRAALEGRRPSVIGAAVNAVEKAFAKAPLDGLKDAEPGAIIREAPLALKLAGEGIGLVLRGAPDLLWFDGGNWRLADYKYSRRPKDESRYLFQIKLYALALMTAHGVGRLEAALVYLRERHGHATVLTITSRERESIREQALAAGARLAGLDGKPVEQWPHLRQDQCRTMDCRYMAKCWGRGSGEAG